MRKQDLISYFFIGLFLFILYQLALVLSPFFNAIFLAAILAFTFYPVYKKIQNTTQLNHNLASLITTAFVVLIVIIPSAIVLMSLLQEAIELYQRVSMLVSEGRLEPVIEHMRAVLATDWIQRLQVAPPPVRDSVTGFVLKGAQMIGNFSTIQLAQFTKNVFLWIFNFFVIAILLFFFFRDGKYIHDLIFKIAPLSQENRSAVSKKLNETFSAVIRGQLVTSIVQALLTGLTFWVLRLPLPFFFGFLAFLASLIPVTGAATIWVPFAIYLFVTQAFGQGIALLLIGTFAISMSDNILKPILIGEKTKLPIFLLFLGILGGLNLYGFTGLFIGPVVISLFFVLLEIYQKEYLVKD
jgi:predicted PurR-regulated permease PerM